MPDVKKYVFTLSESAQSDLAGIKFDNILIFRREGQALQFVEAEYGTETVVSDVYSFERSSERNVPPFPSGKYISRTINGTFAGVVRRQTFEVGSGVQVTGWRYKMEGDLGTAIYDPVDGDIQSDVVDGLKTELEALGYLVDSVTSNSFRVGMGITDSITATLTLTNTLKFESGYFARIPYTLYGEPAYKEYLIVVNSSDTDFPALPSLAGSYDFDDLTYTGVYGTQQYLYNPLYLFIDYQTSLVGTSSIDNTPTDVAIVDPTKVGIDEVNNKLILGTPTGSDIERFDIIHKVP
jgi:hypothetical protein